MRNSSKGGGSSRDGDSEEDRRKDQKVSPRTIKKTAKKGQPTGEKQGQKLLLNAGGKWAGPGESWSFIWGKEVTVLLGPHPGDTESTRGVLKQERPSPWGPYSPTKKPYTGYD